MDLKKEINNMAENEYTNISPRHNDLPQPMISEVIIVFLFQTTYKH